MSILKPLIVILGPTASGKTKLALKLAKKYDGEIINADSRQIYQGMDIGTGKIDNQKFIKSEIHKVRNSIHLIDIKNPNQRFSLSQYKKLAVKTIDDIHKREKIPILVGGTGLYISAIVDNLEIPKAAPNKKIRTRLEKHTEKFLFKRLKKVDQRSAEIIGINNKRKLVRALEVYEVTGKPFSVQQIKGDPLFDILQIGIKIDREKLYEKIDARIDKMIKNGLMEETKKLSKKYSFGLPAM
ncbi:tRNA (adenosine(37)-N6)-dimethylallyltransferase MiaA, partial [Candidatus Parcubacteria bacterium]|nr:tRNA (adenosine(37)-N6)-dimethylallyltransferase MiaA [Candidatus Parcubacteria bacterium]